MKPAPLGNLPIYSKLDKPQQHLSKLSLPTLSLDEDAEFKELNLPAISLESYKYEYSSGAESEPESALT